MGRTDTRLRLKTYDISRLMYENVVLMLPSGAEFVHFWTNTGRVLVTVLETTADVPLLRHELRGFWLRDNSTPVHLRKPRFVGHVFEDSYQQALVFEEMDLSPLPPRG
jgi:hypothetical protein